MKYDSEVRYRAIEAVRGGASLRSAASACGVSREAVRRWCAGAGVAFSRGPRGGAMAGKARRKAADRPGPPGRIGLAQRLAIAMGIAAGHTHARIAAGIGFSRPSVSREISRNGGAAAYDPYEAQMRAEREAGRPKRRKTDADPRVRAYVRERLDLRWSPRQISERMEADFPDDERMRVSHEAIYRALYVQGKGSLRQELKLEKALRTGRTSRVPRSALPPRSGGKSWVDG